MTTTCGKCSGAVTVEAYKRIAVYADMCVQRESHETIKDVNWPAHLQNMGLNSGLLAS